nr:putative ribonuclease H-like domain-containing protein [Tanacetum cinerariifolium]
MFDSISVSRTQTKTIIASLQNELQSAIYKNAKLRTQLFTKVSEQKDNTQDTSKNTKFAKQPIVENLPKVGETNALSKPVTSNSVSTPQESKSVNNDKVIAPGMFRINPLKTSREEKHVPPITVSQPPVITKKDVNSDLNGNLKLLINFVWKFMGTVRFRNDHVAVILGFGQFCDSDLEVAFRRDACFIRNLEGVDLLKGDHSTNLYTINLHEMASTSPIYRMARASSTKSWLWYQRLSYLNFNTINDLARNDLVAGLPKFKYHKEHLCPSCEQEKSKRASHPPKPVPNSRQRLHLLHIDLCGPMRIASIKGKRITFLLQSHVIIIRTDNGTESKNQVLKEYFDSVGISHQMSSVRTPQQNRVVERRNQTLVEATKTILIFSRAPLFLSAEAIATAYIRKLGAKGDIGFFIGYSTDSCAYRIHNRRTKKIMETMNVSFDELSAMAFEQRSSRPGLQSMTSGQISSGLDLTYAPSTITSQPPSEGELDLLFEAMYDDYIVGQQSATGRTVSPAQEPQDVDELNSHAMVDGNTFVNPFANSSTSAAASSSSQNNVKEAMTDPAWIDLMQEELLQFKRLDDYGFELTKFLDADYAGCKDTFKSTSDGVQFLGELGTIELHFVKTDYQLADIFTKALPADRFNYLVCCLGMRSLSLKELERLAKSQIRRWCYNLTLAESKFKTPMLDHQDKHMMKAQVHVSKSSAISDVQALPRRKHYCQNDKSIKWLSGRFVTAMKLNREDMGTMQWEHVQLVIGELRTELGILIQVKHGRLSAATVMADECDAFDSDVDEAPTTQTMFMENLSSADLVYDETDPSYYLYILSEDVIKMKVEALKEQTQALRPTKELMVYPLNTPATLFPRVLPTKSQVKINIFALIQLFLEFEKTCKKRITPMGLTKGERSFEQTKACYLTEAEVDQHAVDKKCDEIERKNLLINNENLIVECLSKEVFFTTTNSELTVSKFTEMHDAHTVGQARCLELEAELSKLNDKIQKDDHSELVKHFFNLETTALLIENKNLQSHINEQMKCVTKDYVTSNVLAPGMYAIDVAPLPLTVGTIGKFI